jgi:hypothetical protein
LSARCGPKGPRSQHFSFFRSGSRDRARGTAACGGRVLRSWRGLGTTCWHADMRQPEAGAC